MKVVNIFTGEVSDAEFATQYKRPIEKFEEVLSSESITETAYIPPQIQIMDMIQAGQRLDQSRRERLQNLQQERAAMLVEDEQPLDVTREPGVDLVDVSRAAEQLSVRLGKQVKAQREKDDAEQGRLFDEKVELEVKKRLEALNAGKT